MQFSAATYSVSEDALDAFIAVTRSGDVSSAATIDYLASDNSASQKSDYTFASGTLKFNVGETSKTFPIYIIDNLYARGDVTINLALANPIGVSFGSVRTASLTIRDNDNGAPNANPIDEARFFVRMQYLDFLDREPDKGGYDYWTGQITQCGADQKCVARRRVAVSAAFFIEQEFQDTGSFVYRLYKAAFSRLPLYLEFMPDRNRVVGGADLQSSKASFVEEFVKREDFKRAYPNTLSPDEFVNRLFDAANLKPYTQERQQKITDMREGGKTRAQVLAEVIEIDEFKRREFNPAFVLAEYFGYLRRDPDANGYKFWLDVLDNRVPGNYQSMVCAFLSSQEYQDRFSSVRTRNDGECAAGK